MTNINLGCGDNYIEGFLNIDNHEPADIIHDLNQYPYPIKGDAAEFILMDNVIEHLDSIPKTLAECHRALHKGGILKIIAPYYKHPVAWVEPTHIRAINPDMFRVFTNEFSVNNPYNTRFSRITIKNNLTWVGKILKPTRLWKHFCDILILNSSIELMK